MPQLRVDESKVRGYMDDADMTVLDLADELGMTRSAIYKIFSGVSTTLNTVSRIAEALGVNPIDILDVPEEPPPHVGAPAVIA